MDLPDLGPVIDAVQATRRCLLTSHVDPEGDSLGSQLALAEILGELGKDVSVVDADLPPEKYSFMPGVEAVVRPADVAGQQFDTAFVVDCGDIERIGAVAGVLGEARIVNIDHHRSNTRFGDLNYIVPDACATGYLIYELNERLQLPLSLGKATNIYASIITDTGNFQYSNSNAHVLRVAARLIDVGLDPARLATRVFGDKSLAALKLLGEGLKSLHTTASGRIGVILLDRAAFERAGATEADAEGVVNFAKRVKETMAGVLLRETPSGDIKVSLRSDGAVDVDQVASQFGGGGHRNAAGARLPGPIQQACERVLAAFDGTIPSSGQG